VRIVSVFFPKFLLKIAFFPGDYDSVSYQVKEDKERKGKEKP